MKTILIGYGQIGKAIKKVIPEIAVYDHNFKRDVKGTFDILLVAFQYRDNFVSEVKRYQKKYQVRSTIIFSTVPIGTTRKCKAVHSPVEGKYPLLAKSLKILPRWVGGKNKLAINFLKKHFKRIKLVAKPEFTEFLKLQSAAKYALNIEFTRYLNNVCDKLGMSFKNVYDFDKDYNELYLKLRMPQFQRYLLTPPKGKLSRNYPLIENTKMLNRKYPSVYLKNI